MNFRPQPPISYPKAFLTCSGFAKVTNLLSFLSSIEKSQRRVMNELEFYWAFITRNPRIRTARARSKWNIDSRPCRDWFRVSIWECRRRKKKSVASQSEKETRKKAKIYKSCFARWACVDFLSRPIRALICATISDATTQSNTKDDRDTRS